MHYDPWLISVEQLSVWEERLEMIALEINLIDLLWKDRPKPQISHAYDHHVIYAGMDWKQKLTNLRQTGDYLFISNPESVCWLLNLRGKDLTYVPLLHCMALVTKTEIILFCEPSKIVNKIAEGIKIIPFSKMLETLKKYPITADRNSTPSALLSCDIKSWQTDVIEITKAKKNKIEQIGMKNCHIRDAVAVIRFWRWLENQDNVTEIEAQDYLGLCRNKADLYQSDSFATISAYGAHGAIVHYRSTPETNVKIDNSLYLLDSGGQYLDGTTDITRTFCRGTATQRQREHYTLVLKGHIALAKIKFPIGTTGAQLDVLARQFLWDKGLDYAHGTGHGVGSFLNVHEGPHGISKRNSIPLEPGMVVSNEPGLYLTDEYGIRIENLQMVQKSTYEGFLEFCQLTLVPYEKNLIEWAMLSIDEKNWLRQYYETIFDKLKNNLTIDEQNWLRTKISNN